ncbi:MAG: hypothetical protein M3R52_07250, partial [Acidobacteriota bacterium]|nr:hypothetical protein [Acidobacteriota bacterium]
MPTLRLENRWIRSNLLRVTGFYDHEPAERAAEGHARHSVARFTGLKDFRLYTQGCAALHPGLYAVACYRRLVESFTPPQSSNDAITMICHFGLGRDRALASLLNSSPGTGFPVVNRIASQNPGG